MAAAALTCSGHLSLLQVQGALDRYRALRNTVSEYNASLERAIKESDGMQQADLLTSITSLTIT